MTEQVDEKNGIPGTGPGNTVHGSDAGGADQDAPRAVLPHTPTQPVVRAAESAPGPDAGEGPEAGPDPLDAALKEASDNRDRWIRAVADLENFKKRTQQERTRLLKYRNEELLRDLVAVLDNLERAVRHCNETERSDPVAEGVCMIAGMLKDVLGRHGIKEISSLGENFDPNLHEAIAGEKVPDQEPNKVIRELEKGYMYQDRLLRPAKVVVSAAD